MPRRIERMPTPGSIAAGQPATLNLPLGPTYHRFYINLMAATGTGTPVNVSVDDWADYVGEVRLMVNGDTRIEIDAGDLVKLNKYHGQQPVNGILDLFLSQPWMRTRLGEDNTAYGTAAGMASFTLEIDLKDGINIGKLEVYAILSEPMAFGPHLRIQRFSQQMGLQGTKEISDLPRGGYNMLSMHLTTAAIEKVEILANNVKIAEQSKAVRTRHQKVIDRVPQAGMTHIDILGENRLDEALFMGLDDFRIKLDFTADNVNFKLYAVSLQGVV